MPRSLEVASPAALDLSAAQRSLSLLQADPSEIGDLLLEAGILVDIAYGPCLSLAAYNQHFQDIVFVWRRAGRGVPDLCSCRSLTLHAGCEHTVFGASLTLPACAPYCMKPPQHRMYVSSLLSMPVLRCPPTVSYGQLRGPSRQAPLDQTAHRRMSYTSCAASFCPPTYLRQAWAEAQARERPSAAATG